MCDPFTATAMALSAGGSYLESREAAKNQQRGIDARNQVYSDYVNKQSDYAGEAGTGMQALTEKSGREGFDTSAQEGTEKFTQAFGDVQTKPDYNVGLRASTPKNVVLARESASQEAGEKTARDLEGMGALRGYGQGTFQQGLDKNDFARMFGNIQSKAGGDTRLLPLEMRSAEINSQKKASLFPTLMKVAGAGMGMYNAAGGGMPGAGGMTSQTIDPMDYLSKGARLDMDYATGGGFGPYRY